jgi:hypothetical protein
MRFYLAFDDTDNLDAPYGTGKLARWFEDCLPESCRLWAVVRQQLFVHDDVPYTSHNSGACLVVDAEGDGCRDALLEAAVEHLRAHAFEGSDPGLCLAAAGDQGLPMLMDFGQRCTAHVVRQGEAYALADRTAVHLSSHGGTGDGVIGAMASVGLTAWGWAGRCIEFGKLRTFPGDVPVSDLQKWGLLVASIDRDAVNPGPDDLVKTNGWCRPRLMGGQPVLLVQKETEGVWRSLGEKRQKQHATSLKAGTAMWTTTRERHQADMRQVLAVSHLF